MNYSPLPRDEVRAAIAREAEPSRVPVAIHFWVHPHEFGDREAAVKALLAQYPQNAVAQRLQAEYIDVRKQIKG